MPLLPALLALLQASSPASRPAPAPVRVLRDVAYRDGPEADAVRHKLDLYLPEGLSGFPSIVFFHGGAWTLGSKEYVAGFARAVAASGIGVAAPNYRLSPGVKHPEHVRDAARAFAWWRRAAETHGADPRRLFVGG